MSSGCCSYAITGAVETFQAIYICRSCNANNSSNNCYCICQSCADECHADHEGLEYIGMGPSYCDCHSLLLSRSNVDVEDGTTGNGCTLLAKSIDAASKLGMKGPIPPNDNSTTASVTEAATAPPPVATTTNSNEYCQLIRNKPLYIKDVYQINCMDADNSNIENTSSLLFFQRLQMQAQTLIQHSKETFWLDTANKLNEEGAQQQQLCDLEILALNILQKHGPKYCSDNDESMGVEWWVQVKTMTHPSPLPMEEVVYEPKVVAVGENSVLDRKNKNNSNKEEGIHLHYDKDETMAELFGIGYFPWLSTVTYLTDTPNASPTVVLDAVYEDSSSSTTHLRISDMLLSYPKRGKHLVFDGRLLHGAPSNYELRRPESTTTAVEEDETIRITFLVNIWCHHCPAGVHVLPDDIRNILLQQQQGSTITTSMTNNIHNTDIQWNPLFIEKVMLDDVNDLPISLRHRIELPFVSSKEDDINDDDSNDDDDDETTMVVCTYPSPPPATAGTTVQIQFGPGMEAYLSYTDDDADEE